MRISYFIPLLLIGFLPVFADSIENKHIQTELRDISVDLQFGKNTIDYFFTTEKITPPLESGKILFYGDEIDISNSNVKMYGDSFSVANIENGIVMYWHYDRNSDRYAVNIFFAGDDSLVKYSTVSLPDIQESIIVESPKESVKYIPELIMTVQHDFTTYWMDTFDIEVITYDKNINANPQRYPQDGKLSGVDVMVILSHDSKKVATLKGVTEFGQWKGSYFVPENLSLPGEYTVDVISSKLGKTMSESSTMFIIGSVPKSGMGHNATNSDP